MKGKVAPELPEKHLSLEPGLGLLEVGRQSPSRSLPTDPDVLMLSEQLFIIHHFFVIICNDLTQMQRGILTSQNHFYWYVNYASAKET